MTRTPLPKFSFRPLFERTAEETAAIGLAENSRSVMTEWLDAYHDRLEHELAKAIAAKVNLAVSPLLGDVVDGLRYEFRQCHGTYPVPGWTTYNCADFVPPARRDEG